MYILEERNGIIQELKGTLFPNNVRLFVKRDDLLHSEISGNKWWKLKYNLKEAREKGFKKVLTFGGAFSNHIAATAAAGKYAGFKTIGVIRGEETSASNPTLVKAVADGMDLFFVSRDTYKQKSSNQFLEMLEQKFDSFYLIPEGGRNLLGVKGCTEILDSVSTPFDFICCACGTGTTLAGLSLSKKRGNAKLLGFSALKGGGFLKDEVVNLVKDYKTAFDVPGPMPEFQVITDYHFGGYAKIKPELTDFAAGFEREYHFSLDLVYTAKMFYGIYDLAVKGFFPNGSSILAIHSGGLQGNKGFFR